MYFVRNIKYIVISGDSTGVIRFKRSLEGLVCGYAIMFWKVNGL